MKWHFLWRELKADLKSAHLIYRAVRAACRLQDEGELEMTETQLNLARKLEFSLRYLYNAKRDSNINNLPLTQAQFLVAQVVQQNSHR